ncbi:MAG: transcriptional regulator [Arthrobacter sp.]|nr:transcriptional regulator [Arthrobacter sp.]
MAGGIKPPGSAALGRRLLITGQLIVFQRHVPKQFHLCKRHIDILFRVHFRPLTSPVRSFRAERECKNDAVTSAGPGRPRHQQPSRPGATARDEILDAAAELFTTHGFASTSTRSIADAVGIRQSSLYHHFKTKDDILEDLLEGTVSGGLKFARAVAADTAGEAAAGSRLHAVALYDGTQLCSARWNLGILYHLPEVRAARFARFLADRQELRGLYGQLGAGLSPSRGDGHPEASGGDFTFRLVESLISLRADGMATPESPLEAADAGLILCGLAGELPAIRAESAALISRLA